MERTDEEIMVDYQTGDQGAVQMLFQRYKVRLFNYCAGMLGNRADAEEIAGDVFLALVAQKQTFDTSRRFSTWLYTIARNKCVSHMRKRKNPVSLQVPSREGRGDKERDIPDNSDVPSQSLSRKEVSERVRQAISSLPSEQKEAIILRQYHGFSYLQISRILDCTLEKVKILIFRAKGQLRSELTSFIMEEQR